MSASRAIVITVSTRTAAGIWADRSGPLLTDGLRRIGFETAEATVVADGDPVERALREALESDPSVIVTTGGTGVTPMDLTPEMTRRVIDREVPGIAEAIRSYGASQGVTTAWLSRGIAGIAGQTLIVNLPGSTGGVRDGLQVLEHLLVHAVEQVRGGDHREGDPGSRD